MPSQAKTKPSKPRFSIYEGDTGVYMLDATLMNVGDPVVAFETYKAGTHTAAQNKGVVWRMHIRAARLNRELGLPFRPLTEAEREGKSRPLTGAERQANYRDRKAQGEDDECNP